MAIQHIRKVHIAGISVCVPRNTVSNRDCGLFPDEKSYENFFSAVGIKERRVVEPGVTCSDLCHAAADKLLNDLGWDRSEVDLLVFLSQTPDYQVPATACILQERLCLSTNCMAFDVNQGCSGWVYGTSLVAGMLEGGGFRKALLLAGDANTTTHLCKDKSQLPIFGAAASVTAFEYREDAHEICIETGTDGTGYQNIMVPHGGARNPFRAESLDYTVNADGNTYRPVDVLLDGPAIFCFGLSQVPKCVLRMLDLTNLTVDDIDLFFFHQANLFMNEKIRKKCKIPAEKVPYSIGSFANTSSASIPVTMISQSREELMAKPHRIIACGFGVGLSWGTLCTELSSDIVLPDIIEI